MVCLTVERIREGIKVEERLPEQVASKVEEFFASIKERKLAVLFGSGISVGPPSSLPSARMLRTSIVEKLFDSEFLEAETRMILEEGFIKGDRVVILTQGTGKNGLMQLYNEEQRYPFEAFIQTVDSNAPILDALMEIYETGKPNKNHILLAELMKRGYVKELLTTNFDTKIEEALEMAYGPGSRRWKRGADFKIFFKESEFLSTDFSGLKFPVVLKIHGTIEDRESMRATLETISARQLQEARSRVIRHFFQEAEHDILIVGYSVSDDFDINPVLRGLKSKNRIFLIKHLGKDSSDKSGVYPLEDPFKGFKGDIICCNTEDVIDHIWEVFVREFWKECPKSENWKYIIDHWSSGLQKAQRSLAAAGILYKIQEYTGAEKLYDRSLQMSESLRDQSGIAISLHNLAIIQQDRGNYGEAEKLYKQSLEILERLGNRSEVADLLHNLAVIQCKKGNYGEAERLCRQSLQIRERLEDETEGAHSLLGVASSLHELAMIQHARGNYGEAESLYLRSLQIRENLGDQLGVAALLNQLANIQLRKGSYDEAETLHKQSLSIKEILGDQFGIAHSLHELAMVQRSRGNYGEAESLYLRSLQMRESLGDKSGMADSLHELANIQFSKGNYDEAESLYMRSLRMRKSLGDQFGIAASLYQLANIQFIKGNYDEAEKLYRKSLEIFERLGNKSEMAASTYQLATIQFYKGNYDEAEKLYRKSLEIFERLGNKSEMAMSILQSANIQFIKGNYDEAENLFKRGLENFMSLGDQLRIAISLGNLGRTAEIHGKLDKAIIYYERALRIFRENGKFDYERQIETDLERLRARR
jgi:tetratricopeptide (TPR) repeat protein